MFKRLIASLICITFICSNLQYVHAQDFSIDQLPVPGTMVGESAPFAPLALKGLVVNLSKPLEFQFIVDTGKGLQDTASIKDQANQLVKYFLAGLTIPEGDLWVNLSPYEKNRMVPQALGQTDLGRDLLAQDYILKQLTASLIYPEKDLGKEFWSRVYSKAQAQFGTTNIPVNTFNKVWILPDQAQVFENANAAYVTKSTLKVMLDEDYLAFSHHVIPAKAGIHNKNDINKLGSQIVRSIILPEITKEVNEGKNFAPLRQIYQALILAKWYKETIQNGLLDAIYTNKNKVAGVDLNDPSVKEQIYERYLKAYKKGAFNYIKEDPTPDGQVVPRKYFSGGLTPMPQKVERDGAMAAVKFFGRLLALTFSLSAWTPTQSQTTSTATETFIMPLLRNTSIQKNEIRIAVTPGNRSAVGALKSEWEKESLLFPDMKIQFTGANVEIRFKDKDAAMLNHIIDRITYFFLYDPAFPEYLTKTAAATVIFLLLNLATYEIKKMFDFTGNITADDWEILEADPNVIKDHLINDGYGQDISEKDPVKWINALIAEKSLLPLLKKKEGDLTDKMHLAWNNYLKFDYYKKFGFSKTLSSAFLRRFNAMVIVSLYVPKKKPDTLIHDLTMGYPRKNKIMIGSSVLLLILLRLISPYNMELFLEKFQKYPLSIEGQDYDFGKQTKTVMLFIGALGPPKVGSFADDVENNFVAFENRDIRIREEFHRQYGTNPKQSAEARKANNDHFLEDLIRMFIQDERASIDVDYVNSRNPKLAGQIRAIKEKFPNKQEQKKRIAALFFPDQAMMAREVNIIYGMHVDDSDFQELKEKLQGMISQLKEQGKNVVFIEEGSGPSLQMYLQYLTHGQPNPLHRNPEFWLQKIITILEKGKPAEIRSIEKDFDALMAPIREHQKQLRQGARSDTVARQYTFFRYLEDFLWSQSVEIHSENILFNVWRKVLLYHSYLMLANFYFERGEFEESLRLVKKIVPVAVDSYKERERALIKQISSIKASEPNVGIISVRGLNHINMSDMLVNGFSDQFMPDTYGITDQESIFMPLELEIRKQLIGQAPSVALDNLYGAILSNRLMGWLMKPSGGADKKLIAWTKTAVEGISLEEYRNLSEQMRFRQDYERKRICFDFLNQRGKLQGLPEDYRSSAMLSNEQLFQKWQGIRGDNSIVKTDPDKIKSRPIDDFEIIFNPQSPIPSTTIAPEKKAPVKERQPNDFILTAFAAKNTKAHVDQFTLNDVPVLVIPSIDPRAVGHLVFLPDYLKNLIQKIEPRHIASLLLRAREGGSKTLKFFHNSFGAGAVLNNLHVHGLFINEQLAIEKTRKKLVAQKNGVQILISQDYPAAIVLFQGEDTQAVAQESGKFVTYLQGQNIPYNVMITDQGVYVIPRSQEAVKMAENTYVNLGGSEMAGRFEAPNESVYDGMTHEQMTSFIHEAGVSPETLDQLISQYDSLGANQKNYEGQYMYHAVPRSFLDDQRAGDTYTPKGFDADGFIHFSADVPTALKMANLFYAGRTDDIVLLKVDTQRARNNGKVVIDNGKDAYPHLYGHLDLEAVTREATLVRSASGQLELSGVDRDYLKSDEAMTIRQLMIIANVIMTGVGVYLDQIYFAHALHQSKFTSFLYNFYEKVFHSNPTTTYDNVFYLGADSIAVGVMSTIAIILIGKLAEEEAKMKTQASAPVEKVNVPDQTLQYYEKQVIYLAKLTDSDDSKELYRKRAIGRLLLLLMDQNEEIPNIVLRQINPRIVSLISIVDHLTKDPENVKEQNELNKMEKRILRALHMQEQHSSSIMFANHIAGVKIRKELERKIVKLQGEDIRVEGTTFNINDVRRVVNHMIAFASKNLTSNTHFVALGFRSIDDPNDFKIKQALLQASSTANDLVYYYAQNEIGFKPTGGPVTIDTFAHIIGTLTIIKKILDAGMTIDEAMVSLKRENIKPGDMFLLQTITRGQEKTIFKLILEGESLEGYLPGRIAEYFNITEGRNVPLQYGEGLLNIKYSSNTLTVEDHSTGLELALQQVNEFSPAETKIREAKLKYLAAYTAHMDNSTNIPKMRKLVAELRALFEVLKSEGITEQDAWNYLVSISKDTRGQFFRLEHQGGIVLRSVYSNYAMSSIDKKNLHRISNEWHGGDYWPIDGLLQDAATVRQILRQKDTEDGPLLRTVFQTVRASLQRAASGDEIDEQQQEDVTAELHNLQGAFQTYTHHLAQGQEITDTAYTDSAMARNKIPGGIDLNQINIKRTGKTIKVQFDPAQLRALEQGNFEGFVPEITGFEYIKSPFPLLGINIIPHTST